MEDGIATHECMLVGKSMYCVRCKQESRYLEFKEKALKLHGDKFSYKMSDYFDSRTHMKILCKTCNQIFKQRPSAHLQGQKCPHCARVSTPKKLAKGSLEVEKILYDYYGDTVKIISASDKTTGLSIVECKHSRFNTKASQPIVCKECTREDNFERRSDEVRRHISENFPEIDLSDYKYSGYNQPITLRCNVHGKFNQPPKKIMLSSKVGKSLCPECNKKYMGRWSTSVVERDPVFYDSVKKHAYLITDGEFFKVGISNNVEARVSIIQKETSAKWRVLAASDNIGAHSAIILESWIHEMFNGSRTQYTFEFPGHTEIFKFNEKEIDFISSIIKNSRRLDVRV